MADLQQYRASDDSWATAAEVIVNTPVAGDKINLNLSVESQIPSQFVIFAVSTPSDQWAPFLDAKLTILGNGFQPLSLSSQSATQYISPDERVAILVNPSERSWTASIEQGIVPFGVSAFAFHPSVPAAGTASAPSPRFRCRICKTTAKALALAIVAAAGAGALAAVLPAALLASVSAFLGGVGTVGTIAAAAFINSVIGDTANVVAEKLCMAVGLCP